MSKVSKEDFLLKAFNTHGDKYDYTDIKYVNATTDIEIKCNTHGLFTQKPTKHYRGQGCPKCSGKNLSNDEFIKKCISVHGNKYDYSHVNYSRAFKDIEIICPVHGKFIQKAIAHSIGRGCLKCSGKNKKSTKQFIEESVNVHGDKYDYILAKYTNSKSKLYIICKNHGKFKQYAISHLKGVGCPKCAKERKLSNKYDFIIKSIDKHGSIYNYDKVIYERFNKEVIITCSIHGDFNKKPKSHLAGYGCPSCGNNNRINFQKENCTSWTITNWNKAADKSKEFDGFKVYIIRCWNDNEEFYKIGRTYTTVEQRFKNKKVNMPYNYEIVKQYNFNTAKEAFYKESTLKRENKSNKYSPLIFFKGHTECIKDLSLIPISI